MHIKENSRENSCEQFTNISVPSVVPVKSTVEISQNFVAFSEYMNFNSNNIKVSWYAN